METFRIHLIQGTCGNVLYVLHSNSICPLTTQYRTDGSPCQARCVNSHPFVLAQRWSTVVGAGADAVCGGSPPRGRRAPPPSKRHSSACARCTQTVDDAAQCAAVARSAHGQPPAWRWVAVAHPRPAPAQGRTRPPLHQRILLLHLLHDRASCGRLGYFVASPCFKTALSSSAAASRWLSRWVSCSSSHNRLASLTCKPR